MVAQVTTRINAEGDGDTSEFTLAAGASKAAAVLTSDGLTSYIDSNNVGDRTQRFDIDVTFPEKFAHIVAVRVIAECRSDTSTPTISNKVGVLINATRVQGNVFTAGTSGDRTVFEVHTSISLTRPGGGDWVEADFRLTGANRFQFEIFTPSQTPDNWVTELYVEVDNIPLNRTIDLEREVVSRWLRSQREPEEIVSLVHGWEAFEAELMDPIGASSAHGPTYDGKGWGVEGWQRLYGILKSQQISLSMPRVASQIGNRRRFQTTFWETMKLSVSGDPDIADGMARLDTAGAEREFQRDSNAWSEDAGGVIRLLTSSKEKFEPKGLLIEGARTNLIVQSSFVNGTTGWTVTPDGPGEGEATFAADTTDLLFESAVSAQSVKLTATSAPYIIDIEPAVFSLAATTVYALSFDWKQSATGFTGFSIQNDTTTEWLQGDGTWGASRVDIVGNEVGTIERDAHTFTSDTATTYTVFIVFRGSLNGTQHNVYHVQMEAGAWASSRIVTEASAVTRAADSLLIRNDSSLAQRIWPVDRFTVKVVFTPLWNSADLGASETKLILDLFHDSSNFIRLLYTKTTDSLNFNYGHGGTVESAQFASPALVAGVEVEIVGRRTTSSGELNETNNTLSVFLGGVKGATEDTIPTDLTQAATAFMQIGALQGPTLHADGHIGEIMISPIVFSDAEIAGGLS